MDKLNANVVVLVLGAGLLLASLLADVVGIGDDAGFGNQQTMGTVADVIVIAIGVSIHMTPASGDAMMLGGAQKLPRWLLAPTIVRVLSSIGTSKSGYVAFEPCFESELIV